MRKLLRKGPLKPLHMPRAYGLNGAFAAKKSSGRSYKPKRPKPA